jgi:hypothetical protein
MTDKMKAATRDASWYDRPNTYTTKKYHISQDGFPACGNRQILSDEINAEDVPPSLRCKKPACSKLYESIKGR